MAKCKDCFFYGCCILNRCSAEADVSDCKVFELESLERKKDLVEVVRCKDCKHCAHDKWCERRTLFVFADDFCSYGERKDNDSNNL